MNALTAYFQEFAKRLGDAWNRFWFTAVDPLTLCVLRLLTGTAAFFYVFSHTADLIRWFGPDGILNAAATRRLTGADQLAYSFHYSLLYLANTPLSLWILHVTGLIVLLAFAIGLWSRITSVGALIVVLSYVHRGPLLTAQLEPVLTMVLAYLCLAPTGRYLSVDQILARRKGDRRDHLLRTKAAPAKSVAANVSTRLIQLHLAALYLTIGSNMLAGNTWWAGEAVWWLMASTESRLFDLTALRSMWLLINLWTHLIVAYQIVFGLLVWNRLARPLILVSGIVIWTSIALITGLVAWCVMMLVASVVFIDADQMRRLLRRSESPASLPEA